MRITKLLLGLVLLALLAVVARAGDITPGRTWVNGEQVTAAKMNDFLNSAVVNSTFFTSRAAVTAPGGAEVFLIYDTSAQTFRKITVNTLLQRTNLITDLLAAGTLTTNDQFMVVNGGTLASITASNLATGLAPLVPFTGIPVPTNLSAQAVFNPASTNYNVYFLTWTNDWTGTNWGPFRRLSAADLLTSYVPKLGTNDLVPYTWREVFDPASLYQTNPVANPWGYTNVVAITNLYHPGTNAPTLVETDRFPVQSGQQGSNTTVTLETLYQYFTNRNALPTYTLARATFSGLVASAVLSNTVDTTSEYVYAVHSLQTGDAVSMVNSIGPASLPASTPALTTNQIYWVSNVNSYTLMLFTNRNDCLAGTNAINITGNGANTSTLFWVTNRSSLNLDVTAVTSGATKTAGAYDLWFRTPTSTTNYYVLGGMQKNANYFGNLGVSSDYEPNTNKLRVATFRYDGNLSEYPRVQVSIQPE